MNMQEALEWLSKEGFIKLYYSKLEGKTNKRAAYYSAEETFEEVFKHSKYSSWNSFKVTLIRWEKSR